MNAKVNRMTDAPQGRVYSYLRWSSEPQTWGDSERRQAAMAETWCQQRGLTLTDKYRDSGVSAYRGRNRESQLGELLKEARRGDYVLVEDNDRLSRENWFEGMRLLRELTARGVTVVTLANGNEITPERFERDPGCFLPAVLRAFLGNDEDHKKAGRLKESWAKRKEALANGKPLRHKLPSWLIWDSELDKPVLVPEKTAIVRRIFDLCVEEGMGIEAIMHRLNDEGTPTITRESKRWNSQTIWSILRGKEALGFCSYVEPPVKVYPAAVEESVYYAANAKIEARRAGGFCAPSKRADTNLFTGLVFCAKCGARLTKFRSKAGGKKYNYFRHRSWGGYCPGGMRYDKVEQSMLSLLSHAGFIDSLLEHKTETSALAMLEGQLADTQKRAEKLLKLIEGDDQPPRRVMESLKALETREADLQKKLENERTKVRGATPAKAAYGSVCDLFGRGLKAENRKRVRLALRDFVEKVSVDIDTQSYEVLFKGAKQAVRVTLHPVEGNWLFNPAPGSV